MRDTANPTSNMVPFTMEWKSSGMFGLLYERIVVLFVIPVSLL